MRVTFKTSAWGKHLPTKDSSTYSNVTRNISGNKSQLYRVLPSGPEHVCLLQELFCPNQEDTYCWGKTAFQGEELTLRILERTKDNFCMRWTKIQQLPPLPQGTVASAGAAFVPLATRPVYKWHFSLVCQTQPNTVALHNPSVQELCLQCPESTSFSCCQWEPGQSFLKASLSCCFAAKGK